MEKSIKKLELISNKNRVRIIEMLNASKSGHPGGALSCIDIVTAIYEKAVDFSSENRARVVLSKGHAVPAVYAELAEKGIIKEEELSSLRKFGSTLQGHPSVAKIPELDASTGLLGQGLSIGMGMAIAKRMKGDNNPVFVICGDGEFLEGQNYEALTQAAAYGLEKLILFLDENKICLSGRVEEVLPLGDIASKIEAFGWKALRIDGHDMAQLSAAVDAALCNENKPLAVVCSTVKGKGVSYMENDPAWHGGVMSKEQYETAIAELKKEKEAIDVR